DFGVIAVSALPNKDMFIPSAAQVLARYRYSDGFRLDDITDWALDQFRAHYEGSPSPLAGECAERSETDEGAVPSARPLTRPSATLSRKMERVITKDAIFHYVYGVLHDPIYREKYALNLKREFPRIPFYVDFWKWAGWGEKLMALHIGYESVEPWPLKRIDAPEEKSRKAGLAPKPLLRANKEIGNIRSTARRSFPACRQKRGPISSATDRRSNGFSINTRKTPKDPTIRENFNTYRFADY